VTVAHQLVEPDVFGFMVDDIAWRAPMTRYKVRRALRDGLSASEITDLRRFGDDPFSWESENHGDH